MTMCSDNDPEMVAPSCRVRTKSTTVGGCPLYRAWKGEVPIAEW